MADSDPMNRSDSIILPRSGPHIGSHGSWVGDSDESVKARSDPTAPTACKTDETNDALPLCNAFTVDFALYIRENEHISCPAQND